MACVYVFFNTKNGKTYVGKTNCLRSRLISHINKVGKGSKFSFHEAIREHDLSSFVLSTVADGLTTIEALEAEKYWIDYFKSTDPLFGYNMTDGGDGFGTVKKKRSL